MGIMFLFKSLANAGSRNQLQFIAMVMMMEFDAMQSNTACTCDTHQCFRRNVLLFHGTLSTQLKQTLFPFGTAHT